MSDLFGNHIVCFPTRWLRCHFAIKQDKIHQDNTPVATTKCRKNPVEVEGMKKSHVSTVENNQMFLLNRAFISCK